jgi:hypothetical protein
MEAASTSETSVNFYQTMWHNIPEDGRPYSHHCKDLKSQFSPLHLFIETISATVHHGQVVRTFDSYPGGPGFKFQSTGWLS